MIVRATKKGFYNGARRYPKGHGHGDSGKPFRLIEKTIKGDDGEEIIITPEEQFSKKWMELVKIKEPDMVVAIEDPDEDEDSVNPSDVPVEKYRGGDNAPPGPGSEGIPDPNTYSEMAKKEDARRDALLRASDQDAI